MSSNETSAFYSITNSAWHNTSQEWRHRASTSCGDYVVQSDRNSSLSWSTRSTCRGSSTAAQFLQVCHYAASTRPKRSSSADSRPKNEWTRDISFATAPLPTRRYASTTQTVHHDAFNSHWTVFNILRQFGSFRRRQLDEVWIAFDRNRSLYQQS